MMHSVLVATRAALQTILADESAVKVTESRVRKLIIDIADRNVKLYCSSTDFNRMEEVLQSLRGEDDIAIALNVDEALHANDLVIESEFGVIHATISAFVETTTRIIRSQLEEGFANLDASEAA
ncbi:MAG: hypothetical protein ACRCWJ_10630, partial [Casimicrobium sp.]